MRVVLDARWIIAEPSGIGVYTRELLARLPKLRPQWHFTALFGTRELLDRTLKETGLEGQPNLSCAVLSYGVFAPINQLKLPLELRHRQCDLYHSPNYMVPYLAFPRGRGGRIRCVTSVHDVIPLIMPDHAPKSRKSRMGALFRYCLRESARRSDAIITVSAASKRDLISSLKLSESAANRIEVIHNGAGEAYAAPGRKVFATDSTTPRKLLYVGRFDPYKNVTGLVEAFASARRRLPFPLTLTLIGPPDPRYPEAMDRARQLGVDDAIETVGFADDNALAVAYATADVLSHPSRYEGFGLPLIEAMRCGLPVVCTDGGAQPEVVGDAAMIVPAGDSEALAEALVTLLLNPARLAELSRKGIERAARFTWDTTAERVAACYERACSTPR